ncbi:hypothetical protein LWI29_024448 [Acer saccharum]|uniref:HTH OST-type domain-containing protein n=1 Tax=Acer saccharum TaxID=4024 RepID=A0AA39TDI3_ACESA|nr:hypothetical protein LWI29_024448 [Acer saccharum]
MKPISPKTLFSLLFLFLFVVSLFDSHLPFLDICSESPVAATRGGIAECEGFGVVGFRELQFACRCQCLQGRSLHYCGDQGQWNQGAPYYHRLRRRGAALQDQSGGAFVHRDQHCSRGKNSADRSLLVDLMYWVSQNPPPAHLFLISGDRDFASILHRLRMNNYNILLASPETAPNVLCSAASIMWHWNSLVRGEKLIGRHFNQPPDGPYGSCEVAEIASECKICPVPVAEIASESKIRPVPKSVLRQIRQILNSYPKGISITDLRAELNKGTVSIDKDLYGYGKFSRFLFSMQHILELQSKGDGQFLVLGVTQKAPEPFESSPVNVEKPPRKVQQAPAVSDKVAGMDLLSPEVNVEKPTRKVQQAPALSDKVADMDPQEPSKEVQKPPQLTKSLLNRTESKVATRPEPPSDKAGTSSEKNGWKKCPSQIPPFQIYSISWTKSSLGHLVQQISELYLLVTAAKSNKQKKVTEHDEERKVQNISHAGVSGPVINKPSDRSRNDVLADCQKLVSEILEKYPEGYNLGSFRKLFLERYDYHLDVRKLGYQKLASLIQVMPGVKIESTYIVPSSNVPCGSDLGMFSPDIQEDNSCHPLSNSDSELSETPRKSDDSDSTWDELGPISDISLDRKEVQPVPSSKAVEETKRQPYPDYEPSVSDDEFSDSEEETSTLTRPGRQGKLGINKEESSLLQILDSWYSSKENEDSKGKSENVNGMVDCSTNVVEPSASPELASKSAKLLDNFGKKSRPQKNYDFVSDTVENNKDKLIDGILGSLKKSVTSMASAQLNIPDKALLVKLYRDELAKKRATTAATSKKKQAAGKSKERAPVVLEEIVESLPKKSPLTKRQKRDSTIDRQNKAVSGSEEKSIAMTFEPDSSMKLLSFGISSFKEPTKFLDKSYQFLLPANDLFLKGKKMEDAFNTGILSSFQGADDEVDAGGVDKSPRNGENLDAAEGQNAAAGAGSIQKDASLV